MNDINVTTSEFSNFATLYPGMPNSEFSSQIESGLVANGCEVIEGYDFAGGRGQYGVYRIMENSGPRDIIIEKMSPKMIKIDNN